MTDSLLRMTANQNYVDASNTQYNTDADFRKSNREKRREHVRSRVSNLSLYDNSPRDEPSTPRRHGSKTPRDTRRHRRRSPSPDWDRRSAGPNHNHYREGDEGYDSWYDGEDDDEERRREIEEFQKMSENEFKSTRVAASTLMQTVTAGGHALTTALGIDSIKLDGLSKKVKKAVKKGEFDSSIRQFSKSSIGRLVIESGSIGIMHFLKIVLDNHIENEAKLIKGSRRGHRKKRRHRAKDSRKRVVEESSGTSEPESSESESNSSVQETPFKLDMKKSKSSRRSRTDASGSNSDRSNRTRESRRTRGGRSNRSRRTRESRTSAKDDSVYESTGEYSTSVVDKSQTRSTDANEQNGRSVRNELAKQVQEVIQPTLPNAKPIPFKANYEQTESVPKEEKPDRLGHVRPKFTMDSKVESKSNMFSSISDTIGKLAPAVQAITELNDETAMIEKEREGIAMPEVYDMFSNNK